MKNKISKKECGLDVLSSLFNQIEPMERGGPGWPGWRSLTCVEEQLHRVTVENETHHLEVEAWWADWSQSRSDGHILRISSIIPWGERWATAVLRPGIIGWSKPLLMESMQASIQCIQLTGAFSTLPVVVHFLFFLFFTTSVSPKGWEEEEWCSPGSRWRIGQRFTSMGSRLVMDDDHHGLIAFSFLKLSLSWQFVFVPSFFFLR